MTLMPRLLSAAESESKIYSVSIVPQLTSVEMHKAWSPVLAKLTAATGLSFELSLSPRIPDFERKLSEGEPDFAFMNPYHMLIAKRKQGYIPLVRNSENLLKGMLLVEKDSPVQSLADLNGKVVAFPAPNSFGASLYIRAQLAKMHISFTPRYVQTHTNVYRGVLMGDVAAGGGVNYTFEREPKDVRERLRVLYVTPDSAPHPFAAHPRIPAPVREKIIESFIILAADPDNAGLFAGIQMPKPIRADYARDYLPLESLGLDKFAVTGND